MLSKKEKKQLKLTEESFEQKYKMLSKRLSYFEFKDEHPSGIAVHTICEMCEIWERVARQYCREHPFTSSGASDMFNPVFDYTVYVEYIIPKDYQVHNVTLIKSSTKDIHVLSSTLENGVLNLTFEREGVKGDYVLKYNHNAKTIKLFYNGIELPYLDFTDGVVIFR